MVALRWIAVLPAAAIAGIIAFFVTAFVVSIGQELEHDSPLTHGGLVLISDGFTAFVFVIAGALVAPSQRKVTAIFLACLVVASLVALGVMTYRAGAIDDVLALIALAVGAAIGVGYVVSGKVEEFP